MIFVATMFRYHLTENTCTWFSNNYENELQLIIISYISCSSFFLKRYIKKDLRSLYMFLILGNDQTSTQ